MPVRILVADDNPHMRAALRRILEEGGQWEVTEAATGEEVLDLARRQTFHLVILDLAMPGMDGISAARVLTERYPSLPILMHTLYWSKRVSLEALKVGVRKVIPKSDKSTILNAIREILDAEPVKQPELSLAVELSPPQTATIPAPDSAIEKHENPSDSEASGGTVPEA